MQHSIEQGMCIVEENAIHVMLNNNTDLFSNCCIDILHKINGPILSNRYYNSVVSNLSEYFNLQDFSSTVSSLSPFDKAKLVFCKMLLHAPNVLVCMRPFAFPDVKMFKIVKDMLIACSENKIAILILSLQKPDLSGLNATEYTVYRGNLLKSTDPLN